MKWYNNLSIRIKLIYFPAILIFIAFAGMSIFNFLNSQKEVTKRITTNELPIYIDNIYNSIQDHMWRDIMVSDVTSNNSFIMDWIEQREQNPEKLVDYLKNLNRKYGLVVTIIVDSSLHYYSNVGLERTMTPVSDSWYFSFVNTLQEREFNVDPDYETGEIKLWVNQKIYDKYKNYLGIASVGIDMTEIKEYVLSQKYGEHGNIMMVDNKGGIKIHKNSDLIDINNQLQDGKTIYSLSGIAEIADELLNNQDQALNYKNENGEYMVITRYIPEFRWFIVVEVSHAEVTSGAKAMFINNLITGLVITIILVLFSILLVKTSIFYRTKSLRLVPLIDEYMIK